jgi:hypothetical protein
MNDLSAFEGDAERERQICDPSYGEGQDGGGGLRHVGRDGA